MVSVYPNPLKLLHVASHALHNAPVPLGQFVRCLPDAPVTPPPVHPVPQCLCWTRSFWSFLWVHSSCFVFLGPFTSIYGPEKIHLTNTLVQWLHCHSITKITRNGLNEAMFVTISPFLVIDDNTIKASINLQKLTNWTTYTYLDAYHHPMSTWPLPKSMIFPFASPHIFLPLEDIPPLLKDTCFDPYFSPFGVKSPKKALQNNVAQRERLVV